MTKGPLHKEGYLKAYTERKGKGGYILRLLQNFVS